MHEYLIYGGYPRAAIAKSDEEKKTVLKNIYSTYFLREIKDILGLTTDFKLSKLIKALSLQPGGLVSYNSLSEVSGLTIRICLRILTFLRKHSSANEFHHFIQQKDRDYKTSKNIFFR